MSKFLFVAKNYDGETKTGEIVAKDERGVAQQLKSDGFLVTSVKEMKFEDDKKVKIKFVDRFSKVSLSDKMMFARNLSVMITAGLTIAKSVKNLSEQTKNKKLSQVLLSIYEDINAGKNLSDSMARFPGIFDELFVNMVKVGEIGGNLDETLQIVSIQLEKEYTLRSKVRGAMIYPAVILIAMLGVAFLMLTYILPQITGVFKDMDVELPKSTQFVINLSEFLSNHSVFSLVLIISFIVLGKLFLRTKIGKKILSFIVLKLPGVKSMVIKINCARFSRIYSSLLKSGVSSIDALKIVSNTLSNFYYKKVVNESVKEIQKGVDLSQVIRRNKATFPILVSQMIEVGEQTGETEAILLKMAEFYEEQVDQATKNLSSIIEPVLMIVMGIGVGFFAVSMLQPMYGLMENIK